VGQVANLPFDRQVGNLPHEMRPLSRKRHREIHLLIDFAPSHSNFVTYASHRNLEEIMQTSTAKSQGAKLIMPYLGVILAVALLVGVRFSLGPALGGQQPFFLFLFAVVFSSRYGGWKPGLLALVLGLLASVIFFIEPQGPSWIEAPEQMGGAVIYWLMGITIIAVLQSVQAAGEQAEAAAESLAVDLGTKKQIHQELKKSNATLAERISLRTQELAQINDLLQKESAERKQAEVSLRHFAAIVQSSEDSIIGISLDEVVTDWNLGAERLYGYAPDEVVGKTLSEFMKPRTCYEIRRIIERVKEGERVEPFEGVHYRKDGKEMAVWIRISPIIEEDRLVGISSISRDLTYIKRLEEQIRQSAKMEAIGRLAGGVAHEFNNMLTAIIGHADMLRADARLPAACLPDVEAINQAADRAAQRTRQLLAYGRKQILQPKVLDLNMEVNDAEQLFFPALGESVRLIKHLAADLGRIRADPFQIEQVLITLATNAADAMPQGGTLTIKTCNIDLEIAQVEALSMTPAPGFHSGAWVMLEITDTGRGMDAKMRRHLFEPFFSAKELGKGTGLGLATVYGIIRQSGGYIDVDSAPGKGTTFHVYLPCVAVAPVPAAPPKPAPTAMPGGSETILLVEDDDMVRRFARALLQMNGYAVLEAGEGSGALKLSAQHTGPIHLLVTDVVMPGMNGRQLAENLAGVRPDMKVLYMSGYTEDAVLRYGIDNKETPFLHKPFTPAVLSQKVRDVLGQTA